MKNRFTGRLGRLFFNAVTLESRSPGSVVMKKRSTTDPGTLRAARHSSMTLCDERRGGFTLIELLVVVLIIGILAAVALPQYQKSVERSRIAAIQPLLRAIASAKASYFMANGSYPRKFEELDISLPSSCTAPRDVEDYGQACFCNDFDYTIYLDSPSDHTVMVRMVVSDSAIFFHYSPKDSSSTCTSCPGGDNRASALCLAMGYPADRTANEDGCLTSRLP